MPHRWMNQRGQDVNEIVNDYARVQEHAFMEDLRADIEAGRRAFAVLEVLAGTYLDEVESDALFRAIILGHGDLDEQASVLVTRISGSRTSTPSKAEGGR